MTKTDKHIKQEVERTMNALDGMKRAAPKPFLYTRMKARLENRTSRSFYLSPVFQRVALATILLVIIFNLYTVSRIFVNTRVEETMSSSEQVFLEEYYPSTPTLYNISQPVSNP